MPRLLRSILAIGLALAAMTAPAWADKRVALVIGNSTYRHVPSLRNAGNDAKLIAKTLGDLGFRLIGGGAQVDLDEPGFRTAVRDFGAEIQGADVALFYYAGHGVQVRGHNFLVPVGANPAREADVDFQMLDTNVVLRQMEGSGARLNLVILDACRNNPFGGRGLRTASSGLAQMQAPEGTLISFATQPGNVALDGGSDNSPFTTALAATIRRPGLDIFRIFNEVGLAVASATGGAQQPWVSLSPIKGDFYFAGRTVEAEKQDRGELAALRDELAALKKALGASKEQSTGGEPVVEELAALKKSLGASKEQSAGGEPVVEELAALRELQAARAALKEAQSAYDSRRRLMKTGIISQSMLDEAEAAVKAAQGRIAMAEARHASLAAPPQAPKPPPRDAEQKVAVGIFPQPQKTGPAPALKPGDEFQDCEVCPKMVVVPAGGFTMGSPENEAARHENEDPQHQVTIAKPFAVGKFEVTRDEFQAFVADSGHDAGSKCWTSEGGKTQERAGRGWRNPGFAQTGDHPVTCVNWHDATAYVSWLARKSGQSYRLLSEAEWEYAARAGTTTPFAVGRTITADQANFNGAFTYNGSRKSRNRGRTVPVGSFAANAFGLHDMHGNVREWTQDCWNANYTGAPSDGSAWTTGACDRHLVRGGSWYVTARDVRSASRFYLAAERRGGIFGFRVARPLAP